jgi:hypothetical protein
LNCIYFAKSKRGMTRAHNSLSSEMLAVTRPIAKLENLSSAFDRFSTNVDPLRHL